MNAKCSPPSTEGALERQRLFETLDVARGRRIIWVSAPAGAGKSTLIATYLAARRVPYVWYNVDARDADRASLFYYLGAAVRSSGNADAATAPLLTADHPAHIQAFARNFFARWFEALPADGVLVFDDCPPPTADWDAWYRMIIEAAEALNEQRCLIFIARGSAPAKLTRFLMSSRLSLLTWNDLRFSRSEAQQLALRRAAQLGLELTRHQVEELSAHSEGWPAGIALALERARCQGLELRDSLTERLDEAFDYFAAEFWEPTNLGIREELVAMEAPELVLSQDERCTRSGAAPSSADALPAEFFKAVRSAFRRYHEPRGLLANPLLRTSLFEGIADPALVVQRLRTMLDQAAQRLASNVRTAPYHRALHHTFLEPAPTQLIAAERCNMSFGTYRRHLQAGLQHVATELWMAAPLPKLAKPSVGRAFPRSTAPASSPGPIAFNQPAG